MSALGEYVTESYGSILHTWIRSTSLGVILTVLAVMLLVGLQIARWRGALLRPSQVLVLRTTAVVLVACLAVDVMLRFALLSY
jgi:hypothetical protein